MMCSKWGKAGRQPASQPTSQAPLFAPKFIVPHFLNQEREEREKEREGGRKETETERELFWPSKMILLLRCCVMSSVPPKHNIEPQI